MSGLVDAGKGQVAVLPYLACAVQVVRGDRDGRVACLAESRGVGMRNMEGCVFAADLGHCQHQRGALHPLPKNTERRKRLYPITNPTSHSLATTSPQIKRAS